ncbi:hypothetical protein [Stigmatella aurantiaca]|uniref:Uncharacterized protein n=1 Tax=Stigmatella aurantiaca (strain DW4/3-1) TaxID=378806 RepID=Q08NJ7_STIAD|nr:hypothetical protein [Stigmatella aurantiaca]EAU62055.1 hypothetical protein STIAU_0953 [Stigmatella aurantiaca DW4/3-1]
MPATAAVSAATRTREVLPTPLARELEGLLGPRIRNAGRPPSIKDAIIRWLNEEL